MSDPTVTVTVVVAWWLAIYMRVLIFVAVLMRREPDWEKVSRVIKRAIRLKVQW